MDIYTEEKNKRDGADVVFKKPKNGFKQENEDEGYLATLEIVTAEIVRKIKSSGYIPPARNNEDNEIDWANLKGKRIVDFRNKK